MQRFNGLDFRNVRDAIAGAPRFLDAPGSLRANDIFELRYRQECLTSDKYPVWELPHRRTIFGLRQTPQEICRAIANRLCCVRADVCKLRGTWPSKIARSASCVGLTRRDDRSPDCHSDLSRYGLRNRLLHQANEVLLAFAKTSASAVMFTRRTSQRDYLGVFAVAFGTAWACTHGGLLLRNCHSLIVV